MNKLIILIIVLLITGCVQNIKQSPLVGNCINWKPFALNEVSVRLDSIPESVLITPDSQLEKSLLQLVGKSDIYKDRCWYRNVKTGGITLEPTYGNEESSYDFELLDGKWFLNKERGYVVIHG